MFQVDAKGLVCPRPVIMAKKALENNDEVCIQVDNPMSKENLEKMARVMNLECSTRQEESVYTIIFKKTAESKNEEEFLPDEYVVVLDKAVMGSGDDELGSALIKSFLYALTESDYLPSAILCYNGGVKLTTEGSQVIADLQMLESKGVEIQSCGACLNFYGLTEKLQVGSVTNMYVILEKQQKGQKVIRV